ncbi:MAG TPA: type II secretion system protein GspG [Pyrinomonadaceae bacterium]|nr:type II secretion system protein GspG [Pyrinomonadaceae bacterium]
MLKRSLLILFALLIVVTSVVVTSGVIAAGDLTPKEARKLIARMAGINLPSDAVRVKEVSAMGNSATVVAQVETAFRFDKGGDGKWRIAEIRTGDRRWEDVDLLVKALNAEKTSRARAELESIATALESYRREHGFYLESKTEAALIDTLNPRYLPSIIRVDPWHQPYQYEGTRGTFVLRSSGPDGQANTADDVVVPSKQR